MEDKRHTKSSKTKLNIKEINSKLQQIRPKNSERIHFEIFLTVLVTASIVIQNVTIYRDVAPTSCPPAH